MSKKSKVIFGNQMPESVYRKAIKTRKKNKASSQYIVKRRNER